MAKTSFFDIVPYFPQFVKLQLPVVQYGKIRELFGRFAQKDNCLSAILSNFAI